jgi:predicted aspartyl protease
MTLPYDQSFSPPAPALTVEVFVPGVPDQRRLVLAKLDTAADMTAVPLNLIKQLGMKIASSVEVAGYEADYAVVSTYLVGIELPQARIRRVEVVPISEDYVLLGRDVLNNFFINLNGPELTFDVK